MRKVDSPSGFRRIFEVGVKYIFDPYFWYYSRYEPPQDENPNSFRDWNRFSERW